LVHNIYRLSDSVLARILTTHAFSDIRGIISREASGGAIKGTFFASRWAKVSADVTGFFARPADSAGPFFVDCFTIYRGCLREFLSVRAAETLFAGVVVAAAACTHSLRARC
jgi:hypothetical protein